METKPLGILAWLLPLALAAAAPAQCTTQLVAQGGLNGYVVASQSWDPDGAGPLPTHVVVAGNFTDAGGTPANGIAAWNPQTATWSAFGSGIVGVTGLHVLPGGILVATGSFASAGGVAANNVAQWTGSAWAPLGAGVGGPTAAVVTPSGQLVALSVLAATSEVSLWNGVSWTPFGSWPLGFGLFVLATTANDDLLLGGTTGIVRWNGVAWSPYAPGITNVQAMKSTPDGKLLAAGTVAPSSINLARWDGSTWTALGPGYFLPYGGQFVSDIDFLPDGDPVICGLFAFFGWGLPGNLARWNGTTWVGFGTGGLTAPSGRAVWTMTFLPQGELFFGGTFAGGLARISTTCPAQVAAAGAGCPGSGGANLVAVETLPWIGGVFRARGTGLPALAFVSQVFGLSTTSLPLSLVLPQGQPGCNLLVMPDFVNFSIATAGTATTELAIPDTLSLAGVAFYHQLNLFEVDAGLNFVAITASNALALTVGVF